MIRQLVSLLLLFCRLSKTAAILLPVDHMACPTPPEKPRRLEINHCIIPNIWKHAIITAIPKPLKPAYFGTSYCPISLLCPGVKVLESGLQPELNSLPQYGFPPNHSTVSALLSIALNIAKISNLLCPPLRTSIMAIHLTKALDMVNHTKLMSALTFSHLSTNTQRWLSPYLKECTASCRYNFTHFPSIHDRVGVPQGACISPILINFFTSKLPQSDNLLTNFYADDFTVSCPNSNVAQMAEALTAHVSIIKELADQRD